MRMPHTKTMGTYLNFIGKLRDALTPVVSKDQYAFPGRGCPMAMVKIMGLIFRELAKPKRYVLVTFWDFSNAFCTTLHSVTLDIIKKFGVSENILNLNFIENQNGMGDVTVIASDGLLSVQDTFNLTVLPVNAPSKSTICKFLKP